MERATSLGPVIFTQDFIEKVGYWTTIIGFCLETVAAPFLIQEILYPTPSKGFEISYFIIVWSFVVLYFSIGYQAWIEVLEHPQMGVGLLAGNIKRATGTWARGRVEGYFSVYSAELRFLPSALPIGISTNFYRESTLEAKETVSPVVPSIFGPGFIYVMRRADGIYKLGRAIDPIQRLQDHQEDYKQEFTLIRAFAVSDMVAYEQLALRRTKLYTYRRETGRKELRRMTKKQLCNFLVEFEQVVKRGVAL